MWSCFASCDTSLIQVLAWVRAVQAEVLSQLSGVEPGEVEELLLGVQEKLIKDIQVPFCY